MQNKRLNIELAVAGVLILLVMVIMPCLNAYVPEGQFGHVSDFTIKLWGKYLTLAILAISVDLLWGYTGLLSLGQSLFFALGGYAFGMHLMLKIGKLGQYKQDIPDFMVFLGLTKLPAHWIPFNSFWFSIAMVVFVPGIVALIFGYLAFRSRIRGVYFSILTQALTYAACLIFFQNKFLFGGNNGLTDFKFILGFDIRSADTMRVFYLLAAALLVATYALCRWLTSSRFGKVQRAIRDSENRVLFSGYATANFKLFVFVVASMIAGMAGALYVPLAGIINPSEMGTDKSLEAVVWVAVGGRGTLFGPILGAFFVNMLKSWATKAYPDYWLIILGGMFVVVVLFLPGGLVSLPGRIKELIAKMTGGGKGGGDLAPATATGPALPEDEAPAGEEPIVAPITAAQEKTDSELAKKD
jgi:urea transport system permease protein